MSTDQDAAPPTAPLTARRAPRPQFWAMLAADLLVAAYVALFLSVFVTNVTVAGVVTLGTLLMLGANLWASHPTPPPVATPEEQAMLDGLRVVCLVPCYNEDPPALQAGLTSLLNQSRKLQGIVVVDDGSTTSEYDDVRVWLQDAARERGVDAHWHRQPNGGKREAQMAGMHLEPAADIYLTVDSDTILDLEATKASLTGFIDPHVQSVAGVILTLNYGTNVLTRMMDLHFVAMQLTERSALSRFGSVMVNSGGCAYYRGDILRDNEYTYLHEMFWGRAVQMSDDSLLTLFALLRGRTIHEPSAFAFTLMPSSFSHHRRQQLRWMRGSLIRSTWRAWYLPLTGFAFWAHLIKWVHYAAATALAIVILVAAFRQPLLLIAGAPVIMGFETIVGARYVGVKRSDQTLWQRLGVWATAPLAGLWAETVLRFFRFWAFATVRKTGWGTRSTVEAALTAADPLTDPDS